jgi:carboxymethylenebutenolidase
MHTETIAVQTEDGIADAYLAHPDNGGTYPAVLFYMDGIGLRPRLYEMAEQLAAHGYLVLVPNLFYRTAHTCSPTESGPSCTSHTPTPTGP